MYGGRDSSRVIDTAESDSAVQLTQLSQFKQHFTGSHILERNNQLKSNQGLTILRKAFQTKAKESLTALV
jgi:hypothetical protein